MDKTNKSEPNRLINEKSPYLLQHAYNPVDWYPWSEDAFEKAEKENKPVFLSIGYSTCHWCHVMEHESFEDKEVAELMNDVFISIKVDREERPDIDSIYMTVCQMMTGHGGWPLTVIMTPDKKPFFAGTYFPKESRYGRIGFKDLIVQLNNAWKTKQMEIVSNTENVMKALDEFYNTESSFGNLTESDLDEAFEYFNSRFDDKHGGFGNSPKFPSPHNLMFLLRYWKRTGNNRALEMVTHTLKEIRKGGIYDHIGKGFHRYSTDKSWLLPHFEKMLYDQAMLAIVYLECHQATKEQLFADTAGDILEYVLRDMTDAQGGFYSAEDADSEGEEGKFYVWTIDEIKSVLNEDDARFFIKAYNISASGNFADESTKTYNGTNIPHMTDELHNTANQLGLDPGEYKTRIENIRLRLFEEREKRIHPLKDDKILTDWNGLMIAAMAMAGRVLDSNKFTEAAQKSAEFIFDALTNTDGSLLHRYRDGKAELNGFLDDYAFLIWGLLELYETTFEPDYLLQAVKLQDKQVELFRDKMNGGFFMTVENSEELLIRTKEIYDGAIPSGNSVSFINLIKISRITADNSYIEFADNLSDSFSGRVKNSLPGSAMFLCGLDYLLGQSYEIILAGSQVENMNEHIKEFIRKEFIPNKVTVYFNEDDKYGVIRELARYTKQYKPVGDKLTAYVCKDYVCNMPVFTREDLASLLT